VKVLKEAGTRLGIGFATFVNIFDPEVIAIGGGVSEAGDLVLEPARRELRLRSHSPSRDSVGIREATLGAKPGMLRAAALVRDEEYVLGVSATRLAPSRGSCRVGFVPRSLRRLHIAAEFSGCLPSANEGKIRSVGQRTPRRGVGGGER
jgi:hypothetical protein